MTMKIIDTRLPKLCHARPGGIISLPGENGEPTEELYLVCAYANGKRAGRAGMMHGLYDDARPLFLVNLANGEAIPMPHLSSRVEIVHDAALIRGEEVTHHAALLDACKAAQAVLHLLPDISTNNNGTTRNMTTRHAQKIVDAAIQQCELGA